MEWIVLFVVCSVLGAFLADRYGGSRLAGALFGLFLGPIGVIIAWTLGGKACPKCRSRIHKDATKCPRCQEAVA